VRYIFHAPHECLEGPLAVVYPPVPALIETDVVPDPYAGFRLDLFIQGVKQNCGMAGNDYLERVLVLRAVKTAVFIDTCGDEEMLVSRIGLKGPAEYPIINP
jgi:hypothetical protein